MNPETIHEVISILCFFFLYVCIKPRRREINNRKFHVLTLKKFDAKKTAEKML